MRRRLALGTLRLWALGFVLCALSLPRGGAADDASAPAASASGGILRLTLAQLADTASLAAAVKEGIFLVEIPAECRDYIDDALRFSYRFPGDEAIKAYSDGRFGGYHDRADYQIESFYVERRDWNALLPAALQRLAHSMDRLALDILKSVLHTTGVPPQLWREGTGALTDGGGQRHVSFNHYRPEKPVEGIRPHCDFGFVSVLYVEKAGLQALLPGGWRDVPAVPGHFVVLLGRVLQILVDDPSTATAAWHRVGRLCEERVSFAITLDNDNDMPVMRYDSRGKCLATVYDSYGDYLRACFDATYAPPEPSDAD